ncbi:MAG: hypothetical protein ISR00_05495 [Flavobacteriales bacterium]|nr:hypothetical protein [Flavobacteriales bacterium]MBL6873386.1 hypothetical protein [Flavobacteriales bacterium]
MKKTLFIFLIFPLFSYSQWRDSVSFPNKLYFIDFLNPTESPFTLDTSKLGSTILQYQSFSTKGQWIDVEHTQSLTNYLTYNLDIRKFSQEGVFSREALKFHDVKSNISFHNKKSTYNFDANLSYQKIRMDENGGVIDYNIEDYDDPLLYLTNLASAENYSKNRFHSFSQNFNFTDKWSVVNEFSILKTHRIYNDNNISTPFYQNNFIDTISTNDSLSYSLFTNVTGLKYSEFCLSHIIQKRHNFIHLIDSTDFDNGVQLSYDNSANGLAAEFKYFESSQYEFLASKLIRTLQSKHLLGVEIQRLRVPIFYNRFYSNHFVYENDFNQNSLQRLNYQLSSKNFTLHTSLNNYTNYIYLNENASYSQYTSSILHFNNVVSLDWKLLNLHASNSFQYQWSNNTEVLRYPDINTSFSLWFQNTFFEDLLDFRLGARVNYFTPYFAKLYNPALASFQLQNNQEVGGLPFISTFITFQVHSMNINIQFLNLNELISNSPHYFMPNYPSQPTNVKFSLLWKLKNS